MFPSVEESWDQIGIRLKRAREKAEMSVEDVVFRARIPRSVVEALEAEDFSVFTSPTYAKSFLRQYSEFLDVDAEPWLNALEPAAYVGGNGFPMLTGAGTSPGFKRSLPENRPTKGQAKDPAEAEPAGKWSTVWVMFLTAALVISVIKGYQTFEAKFGGDSAPPKQGDEASAEKTKVQTDGKSSDAAESPASSSEKPVPVQDTPQPEAPPPRAVIIRE
jgi:cytoskeletal protein RodZ